MADFTTIKTEIDANIVPFNDAQEITGEKINTTLQDLVDDINDKKSDPVTISQNTETGAVTLRVGTQTPIVLEKNVIEGDVTNNPDEVDITATADNKLQFKDRPNTDGMGYKILRKEKTFAEQVATSNTIYEIRYDFDLGGENVTIPANCVLMFNGGSISNGKIKYNKTRLEGDVRLFAEFSTTNNFTTGGYLANNDIYASWFGVVGDGSTDDTDAMQRAVDHINNNMINLHIDRNDIVLTKTINVHPLTNARPYAIIGHSKNDRVFKVTSATFDGSVVFDVDNADGSCLWSNVKINFFGDEKTINGFKFNRVRNSVFQSLSTAKANIGLLINKISYGTFRDCRFDDGKIGVSFDGSFNSLQFDWLHCGGNADSGVASVAGGSPTNIIISGLIAEANKYHIYLNSGVFVFNNPYLADESLTAVVNKGAHLTINGVGNEAGIAASGSGKYKAANNTIEINTIEIDGGTTYLNNILASDSVPALGQLFLKNTNTIRHKSGLLYVNNMRIPIDSEGKCNNIIKTDNSDLVKYTQIADNFALDGTNFNMGINYNLYKSQSTLFPITAEPTISYVAKSHGGGNIMRLTLPICTSKRYGLVIPLRFPTWMIGKYCTASIRYRFNASETNAEMAASGHDGIRGSAIHHKTWVNAEQANANLESVGLAKKFISSNTWYGYVYAFENCTEGTAITTPCAVDTQETTIKFPLKVHKAEDFLVMLFSTNSTVTFTSDLVIDIEQISVYSPEYGGMAVGFRDASERFAFSTAQRPTFNTPANAEGFTMYDTTLKKTIRYTGSGWVDASGASV